MLTCQVGGDKVFLLVQISYSGFGRFLHNYLQKIEKQESLHMSSANESSTFSTKQRLCVYSEKYFNRVLHLSQKRDLRMHQIVSQARTEIYLTKMWCFIYLYIYILKNYPSIFYLVSSKEAGIFVRLQFRPMIQYRGTEKCNYFSSFFSLV